VGLSGSGKSTLVGLLLRHYEPLGGQILIDGVPLTSLDIKWFRQQLGVVNQVSVFLGWTIIRWGDCVGAYH
jgi:ABC-type bacteriocin/lantibiotic exporter with double-glycine peptidase domain